MNTKPDSTKSNKKKKYDCTYDIYAVMAESTTYKDHLGDGNIIISVAHNYVMDIFAIEKFVKAALSTTQPAYLITQHKNRRAEVIPLTLGKMLGKNFQPLRNIPDHKTIESVICGYRLSPNVNLYFDTLPSDGFWFSDPYWPDPNGKFEAEHFNNFLDELRQNSKGQAYRNEQKKRRKQAADNHRSLTKYVNALLDKDHYGRLAVIRMDLAYTNDDKNLVSIDVASAHREKFLANRYHNKTFKNVVGYAWELQYLVGKGGYYNHIFIFLDAETLPDNSWHAAISDYWSGITDEKGRCQNCDKGIYRYNYPGVGIVTRGESEDFIELAASFISKKEIFFSLKYVNTGKRFRTYDKGKIPPKVQRYAGHNPN